MKKWFLFTMMLISFCHGKSFYEDHGRGWHWYEDPAFLYEPSNEDKISDEGPSHSLSKKKKSPSDILKSYGKELENRLAAALIHPSEKNVEKYQEMQKDMMNRSYMFSQIWMKNVYTQSKLDHTLISPVNQKAIHTQLDQEKQAQREKIKSLSKTYGLFFFYSKSCPYCHQFSPIVKMFSQIYGWEVLAISVDGGKIEGFSNGVTDEGLANQWKVTSLPSLFAVNPETQEVIRLAQGMTSIDEIEKRIMVLTRKH